jgi:hypothetical protein
MPGLSKKESAKLLVHVEAQGVNVTPVKNGVLLRLPNGESTTVHFSGSDHRGPLNLRAFLKRNGIDWPTDHNDVKPTKLTLERGEKVLERMGYPNALRMHDFKTAAMLDDWHVTSTTISRFLYYRGYEGVGNTVNRRFVMPSEIIEVPKEINPVVTINETVPLVETTVQHREFLDTHDSWTVDMDILPDSLSVKDMKLMLAAMGIEYEVRVWKR